MNVELSITEQCNLRCTYCYYRDTHAKRCAVMSDEVMEATVCLAVKKSIEFKDSFLNFTFFGGEPLLRMNFIKKTVKFAKEQVKQSAGKLNKKFKLYFSINTNGTLLTDEIIKYLKKEGFGVAISLDGPEKMHNISRVTVDGKGSFRAIKPFIPALVELDAHAVSIVTQERIKGFADSIKWIFKQGFQRVGIDVDFNGKWTGENFDDLIVEYEKLARFWYRSKKEGLDIRVGLIQDKVALGLSGVRQKEYGCFMNSHTIVVATNGNTFPCTRFISSQKNAPYVTGNVLDEGSGVYKGVFPPKVSRFVKNDRKECADCAIRYRCIAHECGCTSYYSTGSLDKISPEVCTHERILCAICDEYAAKLVREIPLERILKI